MKSAFSLIVVVAFLALGAKEPATVVVLNAAGDCLSVLDAGDPFLTIRGLPHRQNQEWIATHFAPPTDPAAAVVELKTADGKRWRAKWVQVP